MKHFYKILVYILIIISFASCESFDEDISEVVIKLPFNENIYIPDSAIHNHQSMIWHQDLISINLDSIVIAHDLRHMNNVDLSDLLIELDQSSSHSSLNFIKNITITISNTENFEEEIVIANETEFNEDETEKFLNFIENDISSYINDYESFYYRIYGKIRPSTIIYDTKMNLKGKIKLMME